MRSRRACWSRRRNSAKACRSSAPAAATTSVESAAAAVEAAAAHAVDGSGSGGAFGARGGMLLEARFRSGEATLNRRRSWRWAVGRPRLGHRSHRGSGLAGAVILLPAGARSLVDVAVAAGEDI